VVLFYDEDWDTPCIYGVGSWYSIPKHHTFTIPLVTRYLDEVNGVLSPV